jgi:hypothetical protein
LKRFGGMNKLVDKLGIVLEQVSHARKEAEFVQQKSQLIHRMRVVYGYERTTSKTV